MRKSENVASFSSIGTRVYAAAESGGLAARPREDQQMSSAALVNRRDRSCWVDRRQRRGVVVGGGASMSLGIVKLCA